MRAPKSGGKIGARIGQSQNTLFALVQRVAGKVRIGSTPPFLIGDRYLSVLRLLRIDAVSFVLMRVYIVSQQGLFRNFDDTFVDLIKPHLERLCVDSQVS